MADYDYSTIGAFNTGNAASLNGDVITKIREAEEKAVLDPIDVSLEDLDIEKEVFAEIKTKVNELLETVKVFDLFSSSSNAFEQVTASTSGTSAVFDAADVSSLQEGTYLIDITQLAQKDVWQSNTQTLAQTETAMAAETLDINGESFDTTGLTLQELADKINLSSVATASVEQVGDDSYRLVLKSAEPGTANALVISGTAATTLGYDDATDTDGDGTPDNHTLTAQNLQATVDGVSYDVSSNSIEVDGNLKVTATDIGTSTLTIQQDDSYVLPAVQEIVDAYNNLTALITEELYNTETSVENLDSLRTLQDGLKNLFFGSYGVNDENAVNLGFEFDRYGALTLNTETFGEALTNDFDGVKDFFLGVAEDKGFGTTFKEYVDDLNAYNGLLSVYEDDMAERKTKLEEEREETVEKLDTKYATMASQFTAYAAIIAQMEASFSGLEMMIKQSTSSN